MKRILCPTDFSATANTAITAAAKLARATASELTLLHVHRMFDITASDLLHGKRMTVDGIKEGLEAQSREVTRTFKIPCRAEVEQEYRSLDTAISASAGNFDLLVMGSDGPDDLYQYFARTNTYNVITKVSIPVLVVPAGYVFTEIKKIVYAFDYLKERDLPLAGIVPWIKALGCELTILQVMGEAYSKEAEDDLMELQFILRQKYGGDFPFKYDTIRSTDIAESINGYIRKAEPDALALCSVHRNLLERILHKSVIKNVSAISAYPVFVFRG